MTQKSGKGLNPELKKVFNSLETLVNTGKKNNPQGFPLRIIHIFAIECHDIIKHTFGLDSRTLGIKLYSSYIAVDGLMPFGFFTKGIALFVPLLSGSKFFTFHFSFFTYNTLSCQQQVYSSSANR